MPDATTRTPQTEATPAHASAASRLDWRRVHLWQIQPVRDVLMVAMVVGLLYVGYLISVVTVPMLIALFLAYLVEPLVRWLCRRAGMSRAGSAIGIIVVAGLLVVVPLLTGLGFAVVQGVETADDIVDNVRLVRLSLRNPENQGLRARVESEGGRPYLWVRDYLNENRNVLSAIEAGAAGVQPEATTEPEAPPPAAPPDADPAGAGGGGTAAPAETRVRVDVEAPGEQPPALSLEGLLRRGLGYADDILANGATAIALVIGTATSVGVLVFAAFLTAVFFFFFVTGWGKVLEFWDGLIPDERKARTYRILSRMDRVIAGFVRGRLLIVAILAVWMTLAYWFIGVPAPFVLGPIVGFLFIVPFVHAIGVPIAMLLMWLQPSGWEWQQHWWWIVFAPIGVYLLSQTLDDWVLSPIIQGKNTDMDMPTILFASLAGGALAGIYGLLIAIPVAACLKILANEYFWPRFEAWAKGERPDFLPISRGGGAGT